MNVSTFGKVYLLFTLGTVLYIIKHGSPCHTQLPPFGPRLMRAKALFGQMAQDCMKELVVYAKTIPPHKLQQVVKVSCAAYFSCMHLWDDNDRKPALDCITGIALNESSDLYAKLKLPREHGLAARDGLRCMYEVANKVGLKREAVDDAVAVGTKGMLSFGWK
ncbi:uncharacterized protein LOC142769203 [Rhipicephalus microplus]|uniref:uncharacterized protein LOC142769203 n=1 Tax=Rhipicephalus microplus TaxID=6941 RepID=UPI003F6C8C99